MGFSTPKKTKVPPPPPPTPVATEVSPEVQRKTQDERRRLLSNRGRAGTILEQDQETILG